MRGNYQSMRENKLKDAYIKGSRTQVSYYSSSTTIPSSYPISLNCLLTIEGAIFQSPLLYQILYVGVHSVLHLDFFLTNIIEPNNQNAAPS
jgi:hypothetical protein